MNNLTSTELAVLNNISMEQSPSVLLGRRIQELISSVGSAGTPVNSVSATATLAFTGVVSHGEYVSIGGDIYEFSTNPDVPLTSPIRHRVDISSSTAKANGTLTLPVQPVSGNTMTIGEKVYTFVPVGTDTADGEVSIGMNLSEAQANIVAAINGTDGVNLKHALVTASEFANDVCTITAVLGGVTGNAIATTETFGPASDVFGATTLGSGASCTAANGATALNSAINSYDTVGVSSTKVNSTVVLTADLGGVAGNGISIDKYMANAAFNGSLTKLAGGINGTVASAGKIMVDSSYLYFTIADNSVSGKNWRRISVGDAF